jgi:hypothetical protein
LAYHAGNLAQNFASPDDVAEPVDDRDDEVTKLARLKVRVVVEPATQAAAMARAEVAAELAARKAALEQRQMAALAQLPGLRAADPPVL